MHKKKFTYFIILIVFLFISLSHSEGDAAIAESVLSAGETDTVGLKSDGTILSTGYHTNQGDWNFGAWSNITQISASWYHAVGLKSDGTVVATGNNGYGRCNVSSWTDIVQVSTFMNATIGVKSDGTVVATGLNSYNQLSVGSWTDIIQASPGKIHSVGLKSDGTVVAVGHNGHGQCDVGSWTNIILISAGTQHTVGLKCDGTVVATGRNEFGQCDVSTWTDIIQVSACHDHTLGLKSDGTVVATGRDQNNKLSVVTWTDIIQVSAGARHSVGLKSDGTVVVAGMNSYGESNVGSWILSTTPDDSYTCAPVWDDKIGIRTASDIIGGSATIEFGTATDTVDGSNVKYNVYYALISQWNDTNWSANQVIHDVATTPGSSYPNTYTVIGLLDNERYIFGVRVEDQEANEDTNKVTLTIPLTKLLIHSDTTDGDTQFIDSSGNDHIVTPYGDTHHSTDVHKFGASAMYFDGIGDYLSVPDSDDWDFGEGDFTIDFWFQLTHYPSTVQNYYPISHWVNGGTQADWTLKIQAPYGTMEWRYAQRPGEDATVDTFGWLGGWPSINTWYHVAITRSAGILKVFIDGMEAGSKVDTRDYSGGDGTLQIGAQNNYGNFEGFLDEIRVSKGIARWTENFSPPTAPYGDESPPVWDDKIGIRTASHEITGGAAAIEFGTATDAVDGSNVKYNVYYALVSDWNHTNWSANQIIHDVTTTPGSSYPNAYTVTGLSDNAKYILGVRVEDHSGNEDFNTVTVTVPYEPTKLLIHSDTTEGSTQFEDSSIPPHPITPMGDTHHSTVTQKFGQSSIYFDGMSDGVSVDYLSAPDSDDWNFGNGDFSVDTWVHFKTVEQGDLNVILSNGYYHDGIKDGSWAFLYKSPMFEWWWWPSDPQDNITKHRFYWPHWNTELDTWHHVAVSRSLGVLRAFVDGEEIGAIADGFTSVDWDGELQIGSMNDGMNHRDLEGYLDEIRISKGYESWIGLRLLLQSDTVDGSNDFSDSSRPQNAIVSHGEVHHSTSKKQFGNTSISFDGSGDYLSITDSEGWKLRDEDFTIDFWASRSEIDARQGIIGQSDGSGSWTGASFWIEFTQDNHVKAMVNINGANKELTSGTEIIDSGWHHIALTRQHQNLHLFIDGNLETTVQAIGDVAKSDNEFMIGRLGSNNVYFHGYLDEIRVYKRMAVWTETFSPPYRSTITHEVTFKVPSNYPTIQSAIDMAVDGDTIIVEDGTYVGAENRNLDFKGKAITLKSESGPDNCIIDCQGIGRAFHFHSGETQNATLSGFTIKNGSQSSDNGGGVLIEQNSSPTITDCVIIDNQADMGGGIYCTNSAPVIEDCSIIGNSANKGGGLFIDDASPSISTTYVQDNASQSYGGGCSIQGTSSPEFTNCIITGNSAASGDAIYSTNNASPEVIHCTMAHNTTQTSGAGGIVIDQNSALTLTNSIVWANRSPQINKIGPNSSADVTYSDVQGGYPSGNGNIDADPLFVSATDYHLSETSPCIDVAGASGIALKDMDNDDRPFGNGYDMGADEYIESRNLYVPQDFQTIQAAVNEANSGDVVDVIIVSDGTYEGGIYVVGKSVKLISLNGPDNCIIDAQGYHFCGVDFFGPETSASILSGFTIRNTSSDYYSVGGVRCSSSSPTIENCIIENCHGYSGGGIVVLDGSPLITMCKIMNNTTSTMGGGISISNASPIIERCEIRGNSSISGGGGISIYGSGAPVLENNMIVNNHSNQSGSGVFVYAGAEAEIINCTIADNTTDQNIGGVYSFDDATSIKNCIIWGNSPIQVQSALASYSDIQGGYAGVGNLDADPSFTSDGSYHILSGSPCRDSGTANGAPFLDFDSESRPAYSGFDMGADEFAGVLNIFTISASASGSGTIDPSGDVPVYEGQSIVFTINSDVGYLISSILVDGDPVEPDDLYMFSYTFFGVDDNHTIHATFEIEDTDDDGLPDIWELAYFGDLSQGPYDDPDGDGVSNYNEYVGESDPTDPNSIPGPVVYHFNYDSNGNLESMDPQ